MAITPAGSRTVPSVVWATNRDVISLDPIFALGYPEYTAESLMCESLLRQAPDGSIEPGLATVANPSPTRMVFTLRPGVRFWDGHPVTSADVVYSLDRDMNPKLGGSLHMGLRPGGFDHGNRPGPGNDRVEAAGLLAGERAGVDARDRHREELRREGRGELRDARRRHYVHWGLHVQVVDPGRRRRRGPQSPLLESLGPPAGRPDHHQGRSEPRVGHRRPANRRYPGGLRRRRLHLGSAEGQQYRPGAPGPGLVERCPRRDPS